MPNITENPDYRLVMTFLQNNFMIGFMINKFHKYDSDLQIFLEQLSVIN